METRNIAPMRLRHILPLHGDAEVAEVALFLCSPLASYVSGQTIEVNGGWRG
jgi:NAD(P)-dependent dehydrogenase (short-subunit alcohol dehydrogenase family)